MARQHDLITKQMTITNETQAERINNMVSMYEVVQHSPMKFPDLVAFMQDTRNVSISKSSWHLLRNPKHKVVKLDILTGVAAFFGEADKFLMLEEAQPSPRYQENLIRLQQQRVAKTIELLYQRVLKLPPELRGAALQGLELRLQSA